MEKFVSSTYYAESIYLLSHLSLIALLRVRCSHYFPFTMTTTGLRVTSQGCITLLEKEDKAKLTFSF